jgi:PIN domain nuclease of toxin-antitoxin system
MSRLLLDTHAFLWWIDDAPQLSVAARRAIADANNECYLSVASCWEMAIKSSRASFS